MPQTVILVYRQSDGTVPLEDWLKELEKNEPGAYRKCLAKILLLEEKGNELRRPNADMLRGGIYELRTRAGSVNYRILYFFCGQNIACLSHGITKERAVPAAEIEHALRRKKLVNKDLSRYTASWEV